MSDRTIFSPDGGFGPFGRPDVAAQIGQIAGQSFYFNPHTGSNDTVGAPFPEVDEALCFSTLQGAIDATVDDRGDVIHMKAGPNHDPGTTVNFNKNGVTLIGQFSGSANGELRCAIDNTDTTGPCLNITKRCLIRDIELASYNATVSQTAVIATVVIDNADSSVNGQGTWFDNVTFKNNNRDAITHHVFNKGAPNVRVSDCRFYGHVTYAPTAGIITSTSGATLGAGRPGEITMFDNYFEDCEYMFEATGASRRCIFKGNYGGYSRPNSAWVKGLKWKTTHTVGTNSTIVIDNYFNFAFDSAHSHTRSDLESKGCLLSGNHYKTDLPGSTAGT